MNLLRMGVMNVTPNSFSDGGEFFTPESLSQRIQFLKIFDAIDIGCESTAPMNPSVSWQDEWDRWQMVLPHLKNLACTISADTYHAETIFELVKFWKDHKLQNPLLWNDVSGKFDESVREFLKTGFDYVYCHNLAPTRELSGRHMNYVSSELDLVEYFHEHIHPQVIFDPCLGFSKTYEQNWEILNHFQALQSKVPHGRWLVGFSRKSFLKKKFGISEKEALDQKHQEVLRDVLSTATGEIWVRTHKPELVSKIK